MKKEEIKNLNDCFEWLDSLKTEDLNDWVSEDENKAIAMAHHGFGTMLRNELGLWNDGSLVPFFNDLGIYHADDMSGIIITSYHRKKNGKKIMMRKQIQRYIKFWDEHDPKVNKGEYK